MILEVTCADPGIIQITKILKTIFQMIQILGPILAMVSLAWIFLRSVAASDNKEFESNKKRIKNCILALLITFFLPVFVNLTMSVTFMKDTFEISSCWKAVDSYKVNTGSYVPKKTDKKGTGTFIIDPNEYKGTDEDPNASIRRNNNYSINSTSSTSLKASLADLALAQQNDPSHKGGQKYWKYMGFSSRVAWCACFVSWNVQHAEYNGQKVSSVLDHKSAGCSSWIDYCKRNKKTTYHSGNSFTPQKGDLIFFDWGGGGVDHIGIVTGVSGGQVHTIEGNTSDSVHTRQYAKHSNNIYGYCSW